MQTSFLLLKLAYCDLGLVFLEDTGIEGQLVDFPLILDFGFEEFLNLGHAVTEHHLQLFALKLVDFDAGLLGSLGVATTVRTLAGCTGQGS